MRHTTSETIIVAMSARHRPSDLVHRLLEEGHEVVGAATTAGVALSLAAQAQVTLAIVALELDGRRDGQRLATILEQSWGVTTVLLDEHDCASIMELEPNVALRGILDRVRPDAQSADRHRQA
ncbi:MAG TPA: hypothetical protein VIO94_00250 [Phenylobacterium sp.]